MTFALRILMQAKVACANTIHELDTIDCMTDDWDLTSTPVGPTRTAAALDIHLHCTYAAEECQAIVEILDTLLANPALAGQQPAIFTEMEVRQENAVEEVSAVMRVVNVLQEKDGQDPEMGLPEMKQRARRVERMVSGLKGRVEELQAQVEVQRREFERQQVNALASQQLEMEQRR